MAIWLVYSLVVMTFWGVAGVTQKLSTNYVSAELSFVAFSVGLVPIALWIMLTEPINWKVSASVWLLGVLGGIVSGLGGLASFAAYINGGKASIVTPLAALYPVITIAIALPVLHEHISLRQVLGIVLAIIASLALSYEGNPQQATREGVALKKESAPL